MFSKNLIRTLKLKNIISEMKYTLNVIKIKLDTIEKINKFKDTGEENIQNETQREKKWIKNKNRALESQGIISSSLIYIQL